MTDTRHPTRSPGSTSSEHEHELPSIEAVLAGTLALMTGYSQALQAELHPARRLVMGTKISSQLAALACSAQLSPGFREVLGDLRRHWLSMTACTLDSQPLRRPPCQHDSSDALHVGGVPPPHRRH